MLENGGIMVTHEKVGEALSVILQYCDDYRDEVEDKSYTPDNTKPIKETDNVSEIRRNASSSLNELAYVYFRRSE